MFAPTEDEYTIQQCADKLGITHEAVRLRIQSGDLKAQKRGRSYYIKISDFEEFVNKNTQ